LVRPDYTIFDEVRRREDFRTFADLRLTGVGMVGVVHANSPLDAIQRFIGKIELGIIPNVIDTVVFVKDGQIGKIYDLELVVKVPTGMTESDLARPVIEIRNFADNVLEHEIYTFGEENVIVPVSKKVQKVGITKLAEDKIRDVFRKFDPRVQVEILSDNKAKVTVDKQYMASIIGKGGSNINEIEKLLKIHIDVVEKEGYSNADLINGSTDLPFTFSESKSSLSLTVNREFSSMHADIFVKDQHVASVRIGRKGEILIPKRSDTAKNLMKIVESQHDIHVFLKDF
jgi:ATPase